MTLAHMWYSIVHADLSGLQGPLFQLALLLVGGIVFRLAQDRWRFGK